MQTQHRRTGRRGSKETLPCGPVPLPWQTVSQTAFLLTTPHPLLPLLFCTPHPPGNRSQGEESLRQFGGGDWKRSVWARLPDGFPPKDLKLAELFTAAEAVQAFMHHVDGWQHGPSGTVALSLKDREQDDPLFRLLLMASGAETAQLQYYDRLATVQLSTYTVRDADVGMALDAGRVVAREDKGAAMRSRSEGTSTNSRAARKNQQRQDAYTAAKAKADAGEPLGVPEWVDLNAPETGGGEWKYLLRIRAVYGPQQFWQNELLDRAARAAGVLGDLFSHSSVQRALPGVHALLQRCHSAAAAAAAAVAADTGRGTTQPVPRTRAGTRAAAPGAITAAGSVSTAAGAVSGQ